MKIASAIACLILAGPAALSLAQAQTPAEMLKAANETARGIQAATGARAAKKKLPPDDPCIAVPLAVVQKLFPGSKSGERSNRLEQYGRTECIWKGRSGEIVLVLQESFNSGTSAKQDVLGIGTGHHRSA